MSDLKLRESPERLSFTESKPLWARMVGVMLIAPILLPIVFVLRQGQMPRLPLDQGWGTVFFFAWLAIAWGFFFGVRRVGVDKVRRIICTQWRAVLPLFQRSYRASEFDEIAIRRVVNSARHGSWTQFKVVAVRGWKEVRLLEASSAVQARPIARRFAKAARLPLRDETGALLSVAQLEETLEQRLRRPGSPVRVEPPRPRHGFSEEVAEGALTLQIPACGMTLGGAFLDLAEISAALLLLAPTGFGILRAAFSPARHGMPFPLAVWSALVVVGLFALFQRLRSRREINQTSEELEIGPERLTQALTYRGKTRYREIELKGLEDIQFDGIGTYLVLSQETILVGRGLASSPAWLSWRLKTFLAQP